jgi:RNA polymerase sigma factor (sigma-70 family)
VSSDERLARLVSRGSARAFALLYQRHHQALYRYCRSIVRDEDDAQDALQSAMMRALAALRAGERDLAVRPWLFRIVHNEAISLLRRRRPEAGLVENSERAGLDVARALEDRERLVTLVADLKALGERQRAALVMRELSGLSIVEIAAALCTSPGAAKQVLFEARCALHDFAEGRAMECEQIRRAVSDGDRRVLSSRKIRGHLRDCLGCRDFQSMIASRSADLQALAPPLPAAAAGAMLSGLLAHGAGGGHAGGLAVGSAAAVGNSAAVSLTAKTLVSVAIVAVTATGTARLILQQPRRHTPPVTHRNAAPEHVVTANASRRIVAGLSGIRSSASAPLTVYLKTPQPATATRGVHGSTPLSNLVIPGEVSRPNSYPQTPEHPSRSGQGHRTAASEPHGIAHRSHGWQSRSHGSKTSQTVHSGHANRQHAPAHPVKPQPQHAQTHREGERAGPAGEAQSAAGKEPAGQAQEHGKPAEPPQTGSSKEGHAPPATPPGSTHSG